MEAWNQHSFQFCVHALYAISGKQCKLLVTIPHFKHYYTIFFSNGFNHAGYHNICFVIFELLKEAVATHISWTVILSIYPLIFSILLEKILHSPNLQDLFGIEFHHFLYQKYYQSPKNQNGIELSSCRICFSWLKLHQIMSKVNQC